MNISAAGTPASSAPEPCARRRRFQSEKAAWATIGNLRERGQDCERLSVIYCKRCDGWHLTRVASILGSWAHLAAVKYL